METLILHQKNDYVIVQMNRGRANPVNHALVQDIRTAFADFERDDAVKGVILTGQQNFFSPGLDLIELYHYDDAKMIQFWDDFCEMMHELTKFSKPLVAAIPGHSHAGGCLLAICCDYRIMADDSKFRIGLNEVAINFLLPAGFIRLYNFWLGRTKSYQLIMKGMLCNPQEALEVGLVEEICPQSEVLSKAKGLMKHYVSMPPKVWSKTKKIARSSLILDSYVREDERAQTLAQWWSPEFRDTIEKIVGRLARNKKA